MSPCRSSHLIPNFAGCVCPSQVGLLDRTEHWADRGGFGVGFAGARSGVQGGDGPGEGRDGGRQRVGSDFRADRQRQGPHAGGNAPAARHQLPRHVSALPVRALPPPFPLSANLEKNPHAPANSGLQATYIPCDHSSAAEAPMHVLRLHQSEGMFKPIAVQMRMRVQEMHSNVVS